jgi:hypothetical protein
VYKSRFVALCSAQCVQIGHAAHPSPWTSSRGVRAVWADDAAPRRMISPGLHVQTRVVHEGEEASEARWTAWHRHGSQQHVQYWLGTSNGNGRSGVVVSRPRALVQDSDANSASQTCHALWQDVYFYHALPRRAANVSCVVRSNTWLLMDFFAVEEWKPSPKRPVPISICLPAERVDTRHI